MKGELKLIDGQIYEVLFDGAHNNHDDDALLDGTYYWTSRSLYDVAVDRLYEAKQASTLNYLPGQQAPQDD